MKKIFSIVFISFFIFSFSQKKWSLQECVDYAVKNNLQVISNQYNAEVQSKNLEISKKEYLPSVSASIGNSASFGERQDNVGRALRTDAFNNNTSIGANVQVYNGGRIKKNIEKSQFDLEASQYDLENIKNNISLQIAQQYLQVLLNKEVAKIAESAVENAEKIYKRAKITTEVGTTPMTVLAESQANLSREKQRWQSAKIDIERARFNLAMLLQLGDYKNFDVQDVPLPQLLEGPESSTDTILETAYANQPQIKAAEIRIKSAQKQTEISKTGFLPTVTASAGIGSFYYNSLVTNNTGFDITTNTYIKEKGLLQQYKDNFGQQLGLNVNIPIFNKGITKLQVEQTKINESIATNTLNQQKQELRQSIQKAYFDANANYQNYLAALETEKSTQLALNFAEKSYEAGRTTIYDLNIARNNYVNAQGSVSQAKYNYIFSMKLLNFYAGIPLSL
ncbi:MAG: TolC family protein [Cloacibacterium sp.]|nr:TolC family protein [Cloacibacterium sp.]